MATWNASNKRSIRHRFLEQSSDDTRADQVVTRLTLAEGRLPVQQVAAQAQQILSAIPGMRSIFAERVSQGFYLNIEVNRAEATRYGLTIADVQQAVTSGIGGEMVAENVEGRDRYPVNVRYGRDFRDNVEELRRVLIGTPSGAQIPVSELRKSRSLGDRQ